MSSVSLALALRDSSTMLRRNLLHARRYPSLTLNLLLTPVVLLLLFLAQALFSYGVEAGRTLSATAAATSLRYALVLTAGVGIALLIAVAVTDLAGARRLLGWLLAGEGVTVYSLLAMVLIIGAVIVQTGQPGRRSVSR